MHVSDLLTIEDIWQNYPDRIRHLIKSIDTQATGINEYLTRADTVGAARQLLQYFRSQPRDWVISTLDSMPDFELVSIRLMADSIVLAGQLERIPSENGGWRWNYTGTIPDDEAGYNLNGHKYLPSLYFAFLERPDTKYIKKFDLIVKDWIIAHALPEKGDSIYLVLDTTNHLDWRDIGEVEWRTLETGNRLGASWAALFFAFQSKPAFSDAARLLMLASIAEQATYLRHYHKSKHNWTTMEMNGLALVGLAFPEFREAAGWKDYALEVMREEINRQVYPDGVQTEISTKTQWVALNRFESVANHFEKAGQPIAIEYIRRLEEMYNYLAYCMRPDGCQPLNNDSDRENLQSRVLTASAEFGRPDWTWIATNGRSGNLPGSSPSITFPWAGISIMRSGWDTNAFWSFFDIGPFGTGHQHRDKLHISIAAFGKDFLVDGGRFTHQDYFSFDPTNWRGYFRSSLSHNVILIDGHGQRANELMAQKSLMKNQDFMHGPLFDYAHGTFDSGYEEIDGEISHHRSVFFLISKFWLILDQLTTDRPRTIQVLWHFHPDHDIHIIDQAIETRNATGPNFQILPTKGINWQVDLVQGQENPVKQGWYSADYGAKVANPTAVYSDTIDESIAIAWLLMPSEGSNQKVAINMEDLGDLMRIKVEPQGESYVIIDLPKNGDAKMVTFTKAY